MRWVMQSVFNRDPKVVEIKTNLERFGIPYTDFDLLQRLKPLDSNAYCTVGAST